MNNNLPAINTVLIRQCLVCCQLIRRAAGHGTDGPRFRRAEETGEDSAHDDENEQQDGKNTGKGNQLFLHTVAFTAGQNFRMPEGNDKQYKNEQSTQNETGNDSGHEQTSRGSFRDNGIDDKAQAWRDKHAERTAAGQRGT